MRFDPVALLTGHPGDKVLSYRGFYIVPARSASGKVRVLNPQGQAPVPVGLRVFDAPDSARRAIDAHLGAATRC